MDAGWYQIHRCLHEHSLGTHEIEAVKKANDYLTGKTLPQIEEFGFLDIERFHII